MVRAARAARAGGQPASQQCGGGSCSAECRDVTRWHLWACSPPTCPRGGRSNAHHRPAADAVLNAQPSSRWKLRGEQQRHLSAAPCSQASGMQSYTVVRMRTPAEFSAKIGRGNFQNSGAWFGNFSLRNFRIESWRRLASRGPRAGSAVRKDSPRCLACRQPPATQPHLTTHQHDNRQQGTSNQAPYPSK